MQYHIEWTIEPEGLTKFKELALEATGLVQTKEPRMAGYHWYFSDDETKCHLLEWYEDAEAILDHLGNVGEVLPKLLDVSEITRFEVFGDLTNEAREALAALGPEMFGHWEGFTR